MTEEVVAAPPPPPPEAPKDAGPKTTSPGYDVGPTSITSGLTSGGGKGIDLSKLGTGGGTPTTTETKEVKAEVKVDPMAKAITAAKEEPKPSIPRGDVYLDGTLVVSATPSKSVKGIYENIGLGELPTGEKVVVPRAGYVKYSTKKDEFGKIKETIEEPKFVESKWDNDLRRWVYTSTGGIIKTRETIPEVASTGWIWQTKEGAIKQQVGADESMIRLAHYGPEGKIVQPILSDVKLTAPLKAEQIRTTPGTYAGSAIPFEVPTTYILFGGVMQQVEAVSQQVSDRVTTFTAGVRMESGEVIPYDKMTPAQQKWFDTNYSGTMRQWVDSLKQQSVISWDGGFAKAKVTLDKATQTITVTFPTTEELEALINQVKEGVYVPLAREVGSALHTILPSASESAQLERAIRARTAEATEGVVTMAAPYVADMDTAVRHMLEGDTTATFAPRIDLSVLTKMPEGWTSEEVIPKFITEGLNLEQQPTKPTTSTRILETLGWETAEAKWPGGIAHSIDIPFTDWQYTYKEPTIGNMGIGYLTMSGLGKLYEIPETAVSFLIGASPIGALPTFGTIVGRSLRGEGLYMTPTEMWETSTFRPIIYTFQHPGEALTTAAVIGTLGVGGAAVTAAQAAEASVGQALIKSIVIPGITSAAGTAGIGEGIRMLGGAPFASEPEKLVTELVAGAWTGPAFEGLRIPSGQFFGATPGAVGRKFLAGALPGALGGLEYYGMERELSGKQFDWGEAATIGLGGALIGGGIEGVSALRYKGALPELETTRQIVQEKIPSITSDLWPEGKPGLFEIQALGIKYGGKGTRLTPYIKRSVEVPEEQIATILQKAELEKLPRKQLQTALYEGLELKKGPVSVQLEAEGWRFKDVKLFDVGKGPYPERTSPYLVAVVQKPHAETEYAIFLEASTRYLKDLPTKAGEIKATGEIERGIQKALEEGRPADEIAAVVKEIERGYTEPGLATQRFKVWTEGMEYVKAAPTGMVEMPIKKLTTVLEESNYFKGRKVDGIPVSEKITNELLAMEKEGIVTGIATPTKVRQKIIGGMAERLEMGSYAQPSHDLDVDTDMPLEVAQRLYKAIKGAYKSDEIKVEGGQILFKEGERWVPGTDFHSWEVIEETGELFSVLGKPGKLWGRQEYAFIPRQPRYTAEGVPIREPGEQVFSQFARLGVSEIGLSPQIKAGKVIPKLEQQLVWLEAISGKKGGTTIAKELEAQWPGISPHLIKPDVYPEGFLMSRDLPALAEKAALETGIPFAGRPPAGYLPILDWGIPSRIGFTLDDFTRFLAAKSHKGQAMPFLTSTIERSRAVEPSAGVTGKLTEMITPEMMPYRGVSDLTPYWTPQRFGGTPDDVLGKYGEFGAFGKLKKQMPTDVTGGKVMGAIVEEAPKQYYQFYTPKEAMAKISPYAATPYGAGYTPSGYTPSGYTPSGYTPSAYTPQAVTPQAIITPSYIPTQIPKRPDITTPTEQPPPSYTTKFGQVTPKQIPKPTISIREPPPILTGPKVTTTTIPMLTPTTPPPPPPPTVAPPSFGEPGGPPPVRIPYFGGLGAPQKRPIKYKRQQYKFMTGERTVLPDLLSVMQSQLTYGIEKATVISPTKYPGVWEFERNLMGYVPTLEQVREGKPKEETRGSPLLGGTPNWGSNLLIGSSHRRGGGVKLWNSKKKSAGL